MCMFKDDVEREYEKTHSNLAAILKERISCQLSIHNWSLKMLSDRSGVPYETIKKVANGKIDNPSLRSIVKIAAAFGCSVDYLAGINESGKVNNHCLEVYSYLNSL